MTAPSLVQTGSSLAECCNTSRDVSACFLMPGSQNKATERQTAVGDFLFVWSSVGPSGPPGGSARTGKDAWNLGSVL